MTNGLRAAVPASALFLLGLVAWPAAEALNSGPDVMVRHESTTPEDRASLVERMRYWEEHGKWPCPESGRPPQPATTAHEGVAPLIRTYGPHDYDCPAPNDR